MEADPFRYALWESEQPALAEFVASFRERLGVIRSLHPHTGGVVESCLRGLEGEPTLGRILVVAYTLNGGVSLRFLRPAESVTDHGDVNEFERLLREIEVTVSSVRIEEPPGPLIDGSDTASLGETESAPSSPHGAAPDEGGVPHEAAPDEGDVPHGTAPDAGDASETFIDIEAGPTRTLSVMLDADSLDPLRKPRVNTERKGITLFELH